MKALFCSFALLTLLGWSAVGSAAPIAGPGIDGDVTSVADRYFMMRINNGALIKVYVSGNTRFELHGAKSDASHVKTGVHVKVAGTTVDGNTIESLLVNVVGGEKSSK